MIDVLIEVIKERIQYTIDIDGIFFFYLTIRKKRRGLSESDWIGKNRSVKKYVLNYQRETISRQWY